MKHTIIITALALSATAANAGNLVTEGLDDPHIAAPECRTWFGLLPCSQNGTTPYREDKDGNMVRSSKPSKGKSKPGKTVDTSTPRDPSPEAKPEEPTEETGCNGACADESADWRNETRDQRRAEKAAREARREKNRAKAKERGFKGKDIDRSGGGEWCPPEDSYGFAGQTSKSKGGKRK